MTSRRHQGKGGGAGGGSSASALPHDGMTVAQVIELMRAGLGRAEVAEAGAKALVGLSMIPAERTAGSILLLRKTEVPRLEECIGCGCVSVLVAALTAHVGVAGVVEQCCIALVIFPLVKAGWLPVRQLAQCLQWWQRCRST